MPNTVTNEEWTYKKWYQDNKERLNESRRERYRSDNEYRDKARKHSREAYRSKRNKKPQPLAGIFKDRKGNVFFTLRIISEVTGLSCWTLRNYHKQGVIPACTHMTKSGWRLYTAKQKQAIQEAFKQYELEEATRKKELIKAYLKRRWK